MTRPLPDSAREAYDALRTQLLDAPEPRRGQSFHTKTVGGRHYWYLEYTLGPTRATRYLGPDDDEWRARVHDVISAWNRDAQASARRGELAKQTRKRGAFAPTGTHGRVLEAVGQAGVYRAGGVLVGQHAFALLGNELGVSWPEELLHHDNSIHVAVPPEPPEPPELEEVITVPWLDAEYPSTQLSIRGNAMKVNVLTPMPTDDPPTTRLVETLELMAAPVRYLEFLLDEVRPAAVAIRQGFLVNVPDPARFALFLRARAARRAEAFPNESRRDAAQAAALLNVLRDAAPDALEHAHHAAESMPKRFRELCAS